MHRSLIKSLAAGTLAALALSLLGCSGDSGSEPSAPGNQPTDISASGVPVEDAAAIGAEVQAAMTDLQTYQGEIISETNMAQVQSRTTITIQVDKTDPEFIRARSVSETDGQQTVMVQIGPDVYSLLPGADAYTHTVADSPAFPQSAGADQLFTSAQQVQDAGEEEVDGQTLHHYILLDTGAIIDVWIDSDHRLVRTITTTQPVGQSPDADNTDGRSTVEMTWHSYNDPLDIQPPDPSEVS